MIITGDSDTGKSRTLTAFRDAHQPSRNPESEYAEFPVLYITAPDNPSRTAVLKKKDPAAISRVRLEKMNEGLCAQTLYVGPYSEEPPTIVMLHNFIKEQGHEPVSYTHLTLPTIYSV